MSGPPAKPTGLLADANVLIDYAAAGLSMLGVLCRHLAPIHVPSPVLDEVRQLSPSDLEQVGCAITEPTLAQASEAAAGAGTISFPDRLCLIVARDRGWHVLTNDRPLRNACHAFSVGCIWGLEAMAMVVEAGHLPAKRATTAAEKIAAGNPFITPAILRRFRARIGR